MAVGLYIYGQVGSGKSAVCNMFYELLEERAVVPLRRKMHFNSAMLEVRHLRCHASLMFSCMQQLSVI